MGKLHDAAERGDLKQLEKSLKKGLLSKPDINERDEQGNTPLMVAARAGKLESVEYLTKRGCAVGLENPRNNLPAAHIAASHGHIEIVKHLLNNGVKITDKTSRDELIIRMPAIKGDLDTVKKLVALGCPLTEVDKFGNTSLAYAASGNKVDVMRYFVEHGAETSYN